MHTDTQFTCPLRDIILSPDRAQPNITSSTANTLRKVKTGLFLPSFYLYLSLNQACNPKHKKTIPVTMAFTAPDPNMPSDKEERTLVTTTTMHCVYLPGDAPSPSPPVLYHVSFYYCFC
jgi:hypothetical protein